MSVPIAVNPGTPDQTKHGDHDMDHAPPPASKSEYEHHEPHATTATIHEEPREDEEYEEEDDETLHSPPRHPIPSMQDAFEESIMESADLGSNRRRKSLTLDVAARRKQLLAQDDVSAGYSSRWRQASFDAKFHPLWKIIAQISFGVHLLHKGLAKSENEVVKILQTHIDEVDSFAEETADDIELAIRDIEDRIECLEVPLTHSREFNRLLCEKTFRTNILHNNDAIERIMFRTKVALEVALTDATKGQEAIAELAKYLDKLGNEWPNNNADLIGAYVTMKGNAHGWQTCFQQLLEKGEELTYMMVHLQSIVDEMARRCGIASRRMTPTGLVGRKSHSTSRASSDGTTINSRQSLALEKPLPALPPVQLPDGETQSPRSSLYPNVEPRGSFQQPRQAPHGRSDSGTSSARMMSVTSLKVVTTPQRTPSHARHASAPAAGLERPSTPPRSSKPILSRPTSIRRPSTPPRSSRRPSVAPIKEEPANYHIDSAYASCAETPYFLGKRSTDSNSSPMSSLASTPKTSISQARSPIQTTPLARPPMQHQDSSRRPSLTALPVLNSSTLKPGSGSSQLIPSALNVKKNHMSSVRNLFARKRQSIMGSIEGGLI
jgi:hypothetical protein